MIVVFVLVTHETHFFYFQMVIKGGFACFLLCYCLFIVTHLFLLGFTVEHNPMLGSHTGGLTCSLQPAIHDQLSTTANIAGISFQG